MANGGGQMINGGWSSVQKKGDYIRVGTMLAQSAEHFVSRKGFFFKNLRREPRTQRDYALRKRLTAFPQACLPDNKVSHVVD